MSVISPASCEHSRGYSFGAVIPLLLQVSNPITRIHKPLVLTQIKRMGYAGRKAARAPSEPERVMNEGILARR